MSSNSERLDLLEAYFVNNKNSFAALQWYRRRYPNRHVPTRKVITNLIRNLAEGGSFKKKSVRQPFVLDENLEISILTLVEAFPETSSRVVAKEVDVSHTLVLKVWKKYGYKCFRHGRLVQALHTGDAARRLAFCRWLNGKISRDMQFLDYILWSDETNFSNNGMYNRRNNHYWSQENPLRLWETHNQIRFSFNCWCGLKGNEVVMVEFYEGNLNSDTYNNIILENVSNIIDNLPLSESRRVYFQQDGAPAHNSRNTRCSLNRQFGEQWIGTHGPVSWPARSPDLTPLDFFLWGYLKNEIYKKKYDSVEELKNSLCTILYGIHPNKLLAATRSVRKRIHLCINQNGEHFEHLIS